MGSRVLAGAVLLLWICCGFRSVRCACSSVTSQLDGLLAEYEREAPPAARVPVLLSLDVRHATVVEPAAALRLLADIHMSWQDSRLTWNASEWGCEWALTAAERLWLPDVALVNAATAGAGEEPLRARLDGRGGVAWASRLDLSIPIALALTAWPNDVQTGVFKFASREHSVDELDLTIKDVEYATVFESGGWEIVSLSGALSSLPAAGGEEVRRVAAWTVSLRRRAPSQALATRVATAAALLLLLAAALLPPAGRAPIAAAAACTAALWLCGAVWRVPGGAGAPGGVRLAGAVCALSAGAAAAAALTQHVARLTGPPPARLRAAVTAAAKLWTLSPPPEGECGTWVCAARLLDAALLAALALALLVSLCLYL